MVAEGELTSFTGDQRKALSRALQVAADDGEPLSLRTQADIEAAIGSVER